MSGSHKRKSVRRSTAVAQQGSHETRSGNVGSDSTVKSAPRKVRKVSVLTLGAYSLRNRVGLGSVCRRSRR